MKTPNIPKLKIPHPHKIPTTTQRKKKENEPEEIQTLATSTDLKDPEFCCPTGVEEHRVGIYLVKHIPLLMCSNL